MENPLSKIFVIFDLDGTLVDSEGLCNQAFLDLIPLLDEPQGALVRRYRGQKLRSILADIEARIGHGLPPDFERHYRQRVADLFVSDLKPMPGVVGMLESIEGECCVASGGPPEKIRHALRVSGLARYFDQGIYSSYDIGSWKPEPGLLQHAARAMGYEPQQCAVIEDSDLGVRAALAAGMKAFQYLPDHQSEPFPGSVPFDDMARLPQLLREFSAHIEVQN